MSVAKDMDTSGNKKQMKFASMKCPILLLLVLGISMQVYPQSLNNTYYVRDKDTQKPVQFAHVIDQNGSALTVTNTAGTFKLRGDLDPTHFIYISHLNYKDYKIKIHDLSLLSNATIIIEAKATILLEIVIYSSPNKEAAHYVLSSYFRGWQLEDGTMKYFYDGLIDYVIPLNEKKAVKYFVKQYRFFRNDSLFKIEKKKAVSVSIGFGKAPKVTRSFSLDEITRFTNKRNGQSEHGRQYLLQNTTESKELINIGVVVVDEKNRVRKIELHLDRSNYYKEDPLKILGHQGQEVEKYTAIDFQITDGIQHEKSNRSYYKVHFKRKKAAEYKLFENHVENYILDFNDKYEKGLADVKRGRSYFKDVYWNQLEKQFPLPIVIKTVVESDLTMLPNRFRRTNP